MKTRAKYEKHLNEMMKDCYSFDEAFDNFIYLTSKQRKTRTTENHLRNAIANGELGTLIRRLDQTLFNTGYYDFCMNN